MLKTKPARHNKGGAREDAISMLKSYGSHYEFRVEGRSGITVLVGRTSLGGFACMPDFGDGCHLVNLTDKFWNNEKLAAVLGAVDGAAVAEALYSLGKRGIIPAGMTAPGGRPV